MITMETDCVMNLKKSLEQYNLGDCNNSPRRRRPGDRVSISCEKAHSPGGQDVDLKGK